MSKQFLIFCLSFIFSINIGYSQDVNKDSLLAELVKTFYSKKGNERLIFHDSIHAEVISLDNEKSVELVEEVEKVIDELELSEAEKLGEKVDLYLQKSIPYSAVFDMVNAFKLNEKAIELAEELDKVTGKPNPELGYAWSRLAMLNTRYLNDPTAYDKGMEYFLKAEKRFNTCQDTFGMIKNYEYMSGRGFSFHHSEDALKYGKLAMKYAEIKNSPLLPKIYMRIGQSFLFDEVPDSTVYYLDLIGDSWDAPEFAWMRARQYFYYGEAYFNLENYQKTIESCEEVMKIGKEVELSYGMYPGLYYLYADANYRAGSYKTAYEYMEQYKFAEDSIARMDSNVRFKELREKYETAEKEKEILLLKEKAKLKTYQFWLAISLLALALILGWLLAKRLKEKHRKKEAELLEENALLQDRFDNLLNLYFDKELEQTEDPDELFLKDMFSILEENLANENFTIDDLPKELGFSRARFYKKVKTLTGKSPAELLRVLRLEKAKKLLAESKSTISEISFSIGFNNPDSFGRAFKSYFGTNPSSFRKN